MAVVTSVTKHGTNAIAHQRIAKILPYKNPPQKKKSSGSTLPYIAVIAVMTVIIGGVMYLSNNAKSMKEKEKTPAVVVNVMAKSSMQDGHFYLNKNDGRGMRVGLWSDHETGFICIKGPKFGVWSEYTMNHVEDDGCNGLVVFEPIVDITEEVVVKHPPQHSPPPSKRPQ